MRHPEDNSSYLYMYCHLANYRKAELRKIKREALAEKLCVFYEDEYADYAEGLWFEHGIDVIRERNERDGGDIETQGVDRWGDY